MNESSEQKCGYVLLLGRPNVGKSTLLNKILAKKISITSDKPQTTRQRILGILNYESTQLILVDAPGVQQNPKKKLNQAMNRQVWDILSDIDVILFMVDATRSHEEDEIVLEKIKNTSKPVFLILNKIDQLDSRDEVLPMIQAWNQKYSFSGIIPLSARTGDNLESLIHAVIPFLPQGPHLFFEDQYTDKDLPFLLAEFVREQLVRQLGHELPYSTTVQIESLEKEENLYKVSALIWVERDAQKPIVLGEKGERVKRIATKARLQMERFLQERVFLSVWVKVKDNWSQDPGTLKSLGFDL